MGDCLLKLHFDDEPAAEPRLRSASISDVKEFNALWRLFLTAEAERAAGRIMSDVFERMERLEDLAMSIETASVDRRFFLTEKGYMGFGPRSMRKNDQALVLLEGRTPFILRPDLLISPDLAISMLDLEVPGGLNYSHIGPCFLHGIMDGKVVKDQERELGDIWLT
jgi:hypothetical protein